MKHYNENNLNVLAVGCQLSKEPSTVCDPEGSPSWKYGHTTSYLYYEVISYKESEIFIKASAMLLISNNKNKSFYNVGETNAIVSLIKLKSLS